MKSSLRLIALLSLAAGLALPAVSHSAAIALATAPLATSTTSSVKPNVLLTMDDSGSMAWDHMPDNSGDGGSAVTFSYGYYGLRSSQCNQVYYNPAETYLPPVYADGTSYGDASFTAAYANGYGGTNGAPGGTTVNLNTGFIASQSLNPDSTGQSAYYFAYTGSQTTQLLKNYNSTSNTFYNECSSAQNAAPGSNVFSKRRIATAETTTITVSGSNNTSVTGITVNGVQIMSAASTASTINTTVASNIAAKITLNGYSAGASGGVVTITGPTSAANYTPVITQSGSMTLTTDVFPDISAASQTNFANWYSYYRTRLMMMKTATGLAFKNLDKNYRVGFMKISSSSTPTIYVDYFWNNTDSTLGALSSQRTNWYRALYSATAGGSTPLRTALSDAGRYYAGNLSGTDPLQQSCQQNFTILSTDGYWNTGNGYQMDGSTAVGNQDGTLARPMNDGTILAQRSTSQLTRNTSQLQIRTQQQQQQTNILQSSTSNLQQSAWQLQKSTKSGNSWPTPVNAASCTYSSSVHCSYAATATVTNVSSCTTSAKTTNTTTGTAYNASAVTCAYTAYSTPATVASCTPAAQSGASPYAGSAVACSYAAQTPTNVSSCTPVAQSGFTVAPVTCPVSDSGWSGTNSCTAGTNNGQTISCNTVTTGPTGVSSCSAASAAAGNSYTATTCNTVTTGPTDVSACTTASASASNGYTATSCTGTVSGGSSDSLSDVASYYYQTDLRPGTCTLCTDNVFTSDTDNNRAQHMTTFTLGLGASGWMNYSPTYTVDNPGDYYSVYKGLTAAAASGGNPAVCTWQSTGSTCNWPTPGMDSNGNGFIANIDDLWHAAVDGHGAYFSATNPSTLSAGLAGALAGINSRKGSAAAAATSTLNPVAGNNASYVASYTTVAWTGNLEKRGVNIITGAVSRNASWCVEDVAADSCPSPGTIYTDTSGSTTIYDCVTPNVSICNGGYLVAANTLDTNGNAVPPGCHVQVATACSGKLKTQVSTFSDTRNIYTANSAGTALTPFLYANLNSANFSSSHINTLGQWALLSSSQRTAAAGANLVNYLRGQKGYELNVSADANQLYRTRNAVLGDAIESQPAYVGAPVFSYIYPGYSSFSSTQASRASNVYIGANDGMMHAISGSTGLENWAYVPSMVIPNMWKLADINYATSHANFVNGSPITSDVCTANCTNTAIAVWKTILVGGLNGGGRSYYALDITDPVNPALLWEFTPAADSDLGYSFGPAVITRKSDGTWVVLVTSGYDNGTLSSNTAVNNSPTGSGVGYLYVLDAGTGAIISKISTGAGTASAPSGLAKIAGWNNEPAGNLVSYVYGGDLLGNLWRFDINSPAHTTGLSGGSVMKLASLFSDTAATQPQPIMTTPILGNINNKRVVFIGTGKYLETADLNNTQVQTQYAIMDDDATATLVNPRTTLTAQTLSGTGTTRSVTNNSVAFSATNRGWYVDFPEAGERAAVDAKLNQGTLAVPTIVPSNTVCSPGGHGWLNFFNYKTGGALMPDATGTGAASTNYDATIVGLNVLYISGQPKISVVTSIDPTPKLDTSVPYSAPGSSYAGHRVLWRELIP